MILNYLVIAAYMAVLSLLTVYCIHRYYILYAYFKYKKRPYTTAAPPAQLPSVTVQLPLYEIGDLNSRRGHIEGMDSRGSTQVVRSFVPLAQMFGYATDLRSMTQGRASYSMELSHYAEVPASVAAELVAKSKV